MKKIYIIFSVLLFFLFTACTITPNQEEILSLEAYGEDFDISSINIVDYKAETKDGITIYKDIPYGEDDHFSFDLYTNKEFKGKPVVFVVHGGSTEVGKKSKMKERALLYAQEGYVVVSPDYKWGFEFYSLGISGSHSVACSIASFKKLARPFGVDIDNLVVHGYSFGGYISSLMVFNQENEWLKGCSVQDELITPVAYIGESSNYGNILPTGFTPELGKDGLFIMGPEKLLELIDIYSDTRDPRLGAINFVDQTDPPSLFFHGTADPKFNEQRSIDMVETLEDNGVESQVFIEQDAGHSIGISQGTNEDVIELLLTFVAQNTESAQE